MKQGDKGYPVMVLQVMLSAVMENCSSCEKINATGFFDASTVRAVKSFQSMTQKSETGNVDIAMWNILARTFNYMMA